ncbi:serine/threonine protein kinase [Arthrobacter cupressi]|uniref:non-specific serine/threonine protein kinase n=1 Tax=Arthrobacter cupressi TaxID=1045773 RepID=A0A1G8Q7P0_9MICC|nr:serine/threonine-protein kinase [Arthrobacter cupressi]SDJ00839.1 serine/threonine protein kinase [Arthrobacter cupressi]
MTDQRVLNGRYELGELLGRGGMADVHRGTDTLLGRTVAVKLLRADLARDPQFQARFKREAHAVASLNHPSIVAIYDTGEYTVDAGHGETVRVPYIVMEYVSGRTLRELIRSNELDINKAVELCLGVLSALEYSHKAGIVHRDIKPGNVMVCDDNTVKVMDFGIARAIADSAATMTQTQAVVGTAQYLSPEQARGEAVDARSDLYSAACLLFEMLTSRPPFTGDSPVSLAYQHVRETPAAPSSFNPEVSEALDSVLAKGLQKERADRFPDAAAFRRALRAALNGIAVPAVTEPETANGTDDVGPGAGQDSEPETLVGFTGIGFLDGNAGRNHANEEPLPANYTDEPDDDAMPLGFPPERERTRRQKSRRRAWTAVVILFTVLVLAGVGLGLYYFMNQKPAEPVKVLIPSVANMSEADAIRRIYDAKLVPDAPVRVNDDKIPQGTAIGTDPSVGTEVAEGSHVTLKVSDGPSSVTVPKNLANQTEAAARDMLRLVGLTASTIIGNSPSVPAGSVISSNPAPGAVVAPGSPVQLVVSSGKVAMPQLVGRTRAEAEKALQDLGLTMEVVEQENSQVAPGTVTRQSTEAKALVDQGSTVTVTVAKAPAPAPEPTPTPSETPKPKPTQSGKSQG